MILWIAALAEAQQPQRLMPLENRPAWIVSVVHKVDLHKLLARMREQHKARVGVPGSAPQEVFNVATGLIFDNDGHVVTRLVNLDPQDKDQKISITTNTGTIMAAQLIGIDCATGFAVLEVPGLKLNPSNFAAAADVSDGMNVKILSADFVQKAPATDSNNQVYISPMIMTSQGQVGTHSIYSKARGAITLLSDGLLSRSDSSIVVTLDNQVIGMAQYAGFGRAYLYPIEFIRGTVARRVLEKRDSVPAGWLGAKGDSLAQIPDTELGALGLSQKTGVVVREILPNSPASSSGLLPNDVIIGMDDIDITGTADLMAMLSSSPAGRAVRLRGVRNREPLEINVVLGARPYSGPLLPAVGPEEPLNSRREELERRLAELATRYRSYQKGTPSRERNEALAELAIEIRQIQESIHLLNKQEQAQQQDAARRGVTADNNDTSRQNPGGTADVSFQAGFTTRDLTKQLANDHFGTRGGILVSSVAQGSAADKAGIKTGDVIVGTNEIEPITSLQLRTILSTQRRLVPLKIVRARQPLVINIDNK